MVVHMVYLINLSVDKMIYLLVYRIEFIKGALAVKSTKSCSPSTYNILKYLSKY